MSFKYFVIAAIALITFVPSEAIAEEFCISEGEIFIENPDVNTAICQESSDQDSWSMFNYDDEMSLLSLIGVNRIYLEREHYDLVTILESGTDGFHTSQFKLDGATVRPYTDTTMETYEFYQTHIVDLISARRRAIGY